MRSDGAMNVNGNSAMRMVYFNSKKGTDAFVQELINRFETPNGKDQKFENRLVWKDLNVPELFETPISLYVDEYKYRPRKKWRYSVAIAATNQKGENILIKKSPEIKRFKKYFQKIIDEKLK